ncbi:putative opsin [Wolfiporia cocos MD-104 SS10]|uniref:Putative opsin n=1 Tax=Wolfiporia cocos (strain MD-104) TaxID=742152 RepID=A0A2H3JYZ6_WOLCO|nr:putative opsin [Wolfiporia cocos MD-104 SS10]
MANASAKRVAQQNAETIKNLRNGMLGAGALSVLLRLLLRKGSLSPSRFSFWLLVLSYLPSIFLSRYLERIGSPRRDPTTGTLISAGEDLARPGIIEWAFDVIYITWACQVGSGAFGEWFWWLYLVIPLYAAYKLWSKAISPMLLGRSSASESQADAPQKPLSKRQEKLQKRSERGDARVRTKTVK